MRLPIPFHPDPLAEPIIEFDPKKPDTDTILKVYEEAENGRYYGALYKMICGSIATIGERSPDNSSLKYMPLVNAEYIAVEAFKLYGLPTRLEGVHRCPRPGCGHKIIMEETETEDSRFDIANASVNYAEDNGYFSLSLDQGREVVIKYGKENEYIISELTFRPPHLYDAMQCKEKSNSAFMRHIYNRCIVDCQAIGTGVEDPTCEMMKGRFPAGEMIRFPDYRDFDRVTVGLKRYGINPFIRVKCPECGKMFDAAMDFTGFFVSALHSELRGMESK